MAASVLCVLGVMRGPAQRRLGLRDLTGFRQHRTQRDIGIHILRLDAQQLAGGVLGVLGLSQLSLRLAQRQIGVRNIRLQLDRRLEGRYGLRELLHAGQGGAVKEGKPRFAGMKPGARSNIGAASANAPASRIAPISGTISSLRLRASKGRTTSSAAARLPAWRVASPGRRTG